jgi:hypothetical protein
MISNHKLSQSHDPKLAAAMQITITVALRQQVNQYEKIKFQPVDNFQVYYI